MKLTLVEINKKTAENEATLEEIIVLKNLTSNEKMSHLTSKIFQVCLNLVVSDIESCEDLQVSSLTKTIETIMTWNAVLVFGRSTKELELFRSLATSFD